MAEITKQKTYEHVGIAAKSVVQTGEYVAGRDIVITENSIASADLRFAEINLEPYTQPKYIPPAFSQEIVKTVLNNRLVVIGGSYEFDKNAFIRHIAVVLKGDETLHKVREWIDRGKNYSVFSAMVEVKEPSIFIFTQITPQDVKFSLEKFVKLAVEHGHFVLMSTDLPMAAWKLPSETIQAHWYDIPSSNLYDDTVLSNVLGEQLRLLDGKIKYQKLNANYNNDTLIVEGYTIFQIATQLETIDQISVFVRSLAAERQTISHELIRELIEKITKNKQDLFRQWFSILGEKEKESLLALSLFDGLYDDQFFNAVEKVVDISWRSRKTELASVDYHDLDTLLNFFNLEAIDEKTRLIRSRFPNQRIEFFKAVWYSHRRQLLSALPALVKLIQDSVYRPYSNWELFGSAERTSQLQEVVSQALSDIGVINFQTVEKVFLQLASDESMSVQEITARALARLRKYGLDDQLFGILHKWQEESRINEIIQDFLKAGKKESKVSSEAFIRSTIALTLGHASEFDKPNELSERLLRIFKEFAKDENEFVRERFKQSTLPQLTRNHLVQLKEHLFDLTKYSDFVHPIALGIADAYNDHPQEVELVIDEWLSYCRANTNKRGNFNKITHRDKLLITIIMALSEIEYKEEYPFNTEKAYSIICQLQNEEYHDAVKKWYLEFIIRQIKIHESKTSPQILKVIENLSYSDRPKLIYFFTDIYIEQRRSLSDNEDVAYYKDRGLPIWIEKERPLTEIEKAMFAWLGDTNQTGQQIAIDVLYDFSNQLEVAESKYIDGLKKRREEESKMENTEVPSLAREERITNFEPNLKTKLISWFTLGGSVSSQAIIKNLLPVLVRKNLTSDKQLSS